MPSEFLMPSLGADMDAGTLVRHLKRPGDSVARGDIIAEVETEKGLVEVEVFTTGVLDRWLVPEGAKVPVGTPLAHLTEAGAGAPVEPRPAAAGIPPAPEVPPPALGAASEAPGAIAYAGSEVGASAIAATPSARHLARERGVDLANVRGTGRHGAITRLDVASLPLRSRVRMTPAARRRARELGIDPADLEKRAAVTLGDVERARDRTRERDAGMLMRQAIAKSMARSKREIPHYYVEHTIDLGPALGWLTARNEACSVRDRVLPGVLLFKAIALALAEVPELNGYYENGGFARAEHVHLGVAIHLRSGGLVAPAIHDFDRLTLVEAMAALSDLTTRARSGRLRSSEMSDATITVTSLGERGVEAVTPVIFPPQVAMVGLGKIVERPWVAGGALAIRPIVRATLAADHRVTDGHLGARFLTRLADLLAQPETL